jgi:hypothetical protein
MKVMKGAAKVNFFSLTLMAISHTDARLRNNSLVGSTSRAVAVALI